MRNNKFNFGMYIILIFVHIFCYALLIVSQQKIIDFAAEKNFNKLVVYSILIILFMIIARVFNYLSNITKSRIKMIYKNELREKVSQKIIQEYNKNKNFEIPISWYTSDIEQIKTLYLEEILDFIFNITGVFIGIYFLAIYSLFLLLATFLATFLTFTISVLFQKKINKSTIEISKQNELFYNKVKDFSKGFSVFWQNLILLKFIKFNDEESRTIENKIKKNSDQISLQSESIYTVSTISSIVILIFSGWLMYKGSITAGSVIAITQFSGSFTYDSQAAFRGIFKIVAGKKITKKFEIEEIENWKFNYKKLNFKKISINNLNYEIEKNAIFINFNYEINKNEKILILGKSGGGKTTLLKLLIKINKNYEGEILWNNKNYKEISDLDIFTNIFYSEQFPHMFEDNIRNNVSLWNNDIQINEIKSILSKLNFKDINSLEDNTNNLSGGEKQKIFIARALLSKKNILIFDEPISSIDFKNGKNIIEYLLSINKTIIIVSHKFDDDILKKFDKVVSIN